MPVPDLFTTSPSQPFFDRARYFPWRYNTRSEVRKFLSEHARLRSSPPELRVAEK